MVVDYYTMHWSDLVGLTGMLLLVFTFFLLQTDRIDPKGFNYSFFNLLVAGLIYHFVSGIRHLVMDLGYWETLMAGRNSAIGTFVLSFIIFILVTLKIW